MEPTLQKQIQRPPRLISALTAGFNFASSHIYLILFPLVFDLLLWFGPHLRLKKLMEPHVAMMNTSTLFGSGPDAGAFNNAVQSLWEEILTQFNLFSVMRTFPIGIPAMFAGDTPMLTPIGTPRLVEMNSIGQVLLFWLLFIFLGVLFGSFFYSLTAVAAIKQQPLGRIVKQYGQSLLLTLIIILLVTSIAVPSTLLLSLVTLVSPVISQIVMLAVGFILIWLLLPLVFSPHGIFIYQQNALRSILTGVRLVRFMLPSATLFILVMLLLSVGLDLIWALPEPTSWMLVIGVIGHAFITTSVMCASFIFYKNGVTFMQTVLQQLAEKQKAVS